METWGGRGRLGPFGQLETEPQGSARLGGGLRMELAGSPEDLVESSRARRLRLELFGDHQRGRRGAGSGLPPAEAGDSDYRLGVALTLTFWRQASEWTAEIPREVRGWIWPEE